METTHLISHIEALIFASDRPLTPLDITDLLNNAFGFMEDKILLDQVETAVEGISEKYRSDFYPFELRQSGGGFQFLTKKDYHKTVAQLNGDKFLKRLSSASLETLAIIAYKQPVTKGEIEAIRGVSSDYAVQKLLEKELIIISGRNEEMPGKPLVYSTSKTFMDYFGINSAADLPKLKEIFADTLVEPTVINHSPGELLPAEEGTTETAEGEETIPLAVDENGELMVHGEDAGEQMEEDKEVTEQEETDDHEETEHEETEAEGDNGDTNEENLTEEEQTRTDEEDKGRGEDTDDEHNDNKTGPDKEDEKNV